MLKNVKKTAPALHVQDGIDLYLKVEQENAELKVFLIEPGVFELVGGIIGVGFGSAISLLIPYLGIQALGFRGDLRATITTGTVLFALVFSVVIGILSGTIPARHTAKMRPVDALRYDQRERALTFASIRAM